MKTALVTGCSSGVGKAAALALAECGFEAYATARNVESLDELQEAGCHVLPLDVTSGESMTAAVRKVLSEQGSIDVLVNNAGYGEYGPIEELDLDLVRKQFETNVFGLIQMCQLVLPVMRKKKSGRIINVSSMAGELVFPIGGAYHASKYAVEAISDALRVEVKPFGVHVTVVQPGPLATNFSLALTKSVAMEPNGGPYDVYKGSIGAAFTEFYKHPRGGSTASHVAEAILEAATAPRPRTRIKVSFLANTLPRLRRLSPDWLWDAGMEVEFPHPKTSPP